MEYTTKIGTDIEEAAYWLSKGVCVAIPTETVYGLAANALEPEAVLRIFETKNRPHFDPLIIHVADAARVSDFSQEIPEQIRRLIDAFWPGPLTVLLERNEVVPDLVCSGLPRAAFRAPAHPLAQDLLRNLPFPLAAPSANPFGYISPTTAQHVADQLGGRIPYILDGGACGIGLESTIVGMEADGLHVYRLGGTPLETLEAVVGSLVESVAQNSNPSAPGMLSTHYAPRKKLLLSNFDRIPAENQLGVLQFDGGSQFFKDDQRVVARLVLSETGDLKEAAQTLFAQLRSLDSSEADVLVAEKCPDEFLGKAINDRLKRAAV
jgi:L-threonylcarbamoyladenylate synthase